MCEQSIHNKANNIFTHEYTHFAVFETGAVHAHFVILSASSNSTFGIRALTLCMETYAALLSFIFKKIQIQNMSFNTIKIILICYACLLLLILGFFCFKYFLWERNISFGFFKGMSTNLLLFLSSLKFMKIIAIRDNYLKKK